MGGWLGGVEKLRIKLSQLSTKVEVEVEAELGNILVGGYSRDRKNIFWLVTEHFWDEIGCEIFWLEGTQMSASIFISATAWL